MKRGTFPSSNGTDTITWFAWEPEEENGRGDGKTEAEPELEPLESDEEPQEDVRQKPRAVLQIVHGMCEYTERYERFARWAADHGILVCGNDHLGHGDSVKSEEDFGYFGEKDGWTYLVEDVHRLTVRMQEAYPDVPYFMLGHSMGSFVARAFLSKYGDELSGAIIMGTSGRNRMAPLALPLVAAMKKTKGGRYRSPLIRAIAFGTYNTKFKPPRTEYDWISQDEETVDRYNADCRCTFTFTLDGFLDLFHILQYVSRKEGAEEVPADLPVILLSGSMDPVGGYGKGVKEVHDALAFAGLRDLMIRIYPGCRHELLNETCWEKIAEDILHWMEKRIDQAK